MNNLQQTAMSIAYKHFISLRWIDRTPGDRATANEGLGTPFRVSGFVVSVSGEWFLVTAGHILEDVDKSLQAGQILEEWTLDDGARPDAKHPELIPFAFAGSAKHYFYNPEVGDYGCIHLSHMYCELLKKNGIVAFDERAWRISGEFERYWLLGIPTQLVEVEVVDGKMQEQNWHVIIGVDRISSPPEGVKQGAFFYGLLSDGLVDERGRTLTNIDGLSGAPILGWRRGGDGRFRYWIVAVQSSWYPSKRLVVASPFQVYAEWLGRLLARTTKE